jgi:hypothetical protein
MPVRWHIGPVERYLGETLAKHSAEKQALPADVTVQLILVNPEPSGLMLRDSRRNVVLSWRSEPDVTDAG